MKYTLLGTPLPMARPRFSHGRVFYPQKKEKLAYGLMIKKQHGNKVHEIPIALTLTFFMPIPKSYSKKKRDLIMRGELYHIKKPDIDNLTAFILNCMTGIVYKDDAQVYSITAEKKFSDNPRTEIVIQCQQ